MADLTNVRDELIAAAARILGRPLTPKEEQELIDAYNRTSGEIFDRCKDALEEVCDVDLSVRELMEKAASVDRINLALRNLRNIAASNARKR